MEEGRNETGRAIKEILTDVACLSALFVATFIGFHVAKARGFFEVATNPQSYNAPSNAPSQESSKAFAAAERIDVHDSVASRPSAAIKQHVQAEEQAEELPGPNPQLDKELNSADLQPTASDIAFTQTIRFEKEQRDYMAEQKKARQDDLQGLIREEQGRTQQSILDSNSN